MAAIVYAGLTAGVVAFLLALAFGAPWGELTMGGKYRGRLPVAMRVACVVQAAVLVLLAVVVWRSAGLAGPGLQLQARGALWIVMVFCTVSLVLNLVTPSRRERRLWAPVAAAMLLSSGLVAING